ncbi:MAG TPA: hypothetical protein DIU37_06565 [Opitutae bacterium]|nr:hypothetical protein [Opitutae bacterium]|tara:strand:+ start:267 stop:677 length:411 start_codon:yes stop_codon:yes gene_type:complete
MPKKAVKKTVKKKTAPKAVKRVAAKKKLATTKTTAKKAIKKESRASSSKSGALSTHVTAIADVGWGNALYIRGEGGGLSWERGILMKNKGASTWNWSTKSAKHPITFKVLINDERWASGEDCEVKAGTTWTGHPHF